jgi:pantetheine-phosphate adenylyltransferase
MDLIHRACKTFPRLIVAVAVNINKQSMFTVEERVEMLSAALSGIPEVEVDSFRGLLVDYAKDKNVNVVLRGLRAFSDFENEFQMALMNRRLAPKVETFFMMTSQDNFYVSSQTVKEVAHFGGDISGLVPEVVLNKLRERNAKKSTR